MPEQLAFPLPIKTALGRDNFFVSAANQLAVATLEDAALWPNGKLILCGPVASGKTHLACVWAGEAGARIVAATALPTLDLGQGALGPLVVEDIDQLAASEETTLFHLHNLMLAEGRPLLMTTTRPPGQLDIALPDLMSRLQGTALVTLDAPDDALLSVVLCKLFADRQITISGGLLDYILPRLERSFAAARAFVDEMDRRALSEGKPIGKRLAGEILTPKAG
ncbi:MAG: DnaA/Hda family protein [Pseudomonadota bacterium]